MHFVSFFSPPMKLLVSCWLVAVLTGIYVEMPVSSTMVLADSPPLGGSVSGKTYGKCGTRLTITPTPGANPKLVTFDLSRISGEKVVYGPYSDGSTGEDFYFSPCNSVPNIQCPENPEHQSDPLIGMGIAKGDQGACNVLGTWDADSAVWSPLLDEGTGKVVGIQLKGGEGATCAVNSMEKFSLTTNFNCYTDDAQTKKASLKASGFLADMGNDCNPVYQINTCLACPDGCGAQPLPATPSSDPIHVDPPGMGWFAVLCIIVFVVILPLYVGIGYIVKTREGHSGLSALPPPFHRCAQSEAPYKYGASGSYQENDYGSI